MFYPAARDQSGDLAKSLAPHGVMVVTARVYEMNDVAALDRRGSSAGSRAASSGRRCFIRGGRRRPLSTRAAPKIGRDVATRLGMLCLSEAVAEPLVAARFVRVGLADYPSEEAHDGSLPCLLPATKTRHDAGRVRGIRLMAERKQGPVKPPTIDLTARDAAAGRRAARRTGSRRPAAEAVEPVVEPVEPIEEVVAVGRGVGLGRRRLAAAAADPARAADTA